VAGHADRVRLRLDARVAEKLTRIEDQEAAAHAAARDFAGRVALAVQNRAQAERELQFLEEQARFGRDVGGPGGIDDLRERLTVRTAEVSRLAAARDAAEVKRTNLRRLVESCHRYLELA
jgi:hypothetical protein